MGASSDPTAVKLTNKAVPTAAEPVEPSHQDLERAIKCHRLAVGAGDPTSPPVFRLRPRSNSRTSPRGS